MAKEKNKTELPQVLEGELQARLIKLREDAGYSTAQMADALCLSEEVILNLENEEFDLLAEPPYVRGYLRNYAKLGESDPSELINRYEALRGADASELDYQIKTSSHIDFKSRKRLSPVLAQLILLAVLLAGIGGLTMIPAVNQWFKSTWKNFTSQIQNQPSETSNPLLTGTMPVPIPLPETETPIAGSADEVPLKLPNQTPDTENITTNESQAESATPETTDTKTAETTTDSVTATPEPVAQTQTDESAQTSTTDPNAPIKIKLIFNKEVWMRIKNKESKTIFESINKAGTDRSLEFNKPLTFRVGNAQGLTLFVDDKAVDISKYINGSIANFTLE